jgi:hypothetical protein
MWFEFKSTSYEPRVMMRPGFCGVGAGPRTIFKVKATRAYLIEKFSHFQGARCEHEVLFRPLSLFEVGTGGDGCLHVHAEPWSPHTHAMRYQVLAQALALNPER